MPDQPSRLRSVLIAWAAVWPTVTLLLMATEPLTRHWPIVLRSLLVSVIMVPAMVLFVIPVLTQAVDKLLGTSEPHDP